jgi:hypothetical protein
MAYVPVFMKAIEDLVLASREFYQLELLRAASEFWAR